MNVEEKQSQEAYDAMLERMRWHQATHPPKHRWFFTLWALVFLATVAVILTAMLAS
jgi:hypothetical protein